MIGQGKTWRRRINPARESGVVTHFKAQKCGTGGNTARATGIIEAAKNPP